jgi:hypothetical protein
VEFVSPPASVVVGDTTPIQVRALNRSGDPIPDATITLFSLAPDTIAVPPGRLAVVGLVPGSGRIVAQAEQLRSDPLRISVTAP